LKKESFLFHPGGLETFLLALSMEIEKTIVGTCAHLQDMDFFVDMLV